MTKKFILKILTAGEGGVGKTTLLQRYVEGKFSEETKMTIGVEFFLKEMEIDEKHCTLQLWDFGGQERFRFLLESYVLDGEVEVTDSETGEKINFKTGDLVQFEKGLKCVWNVKKPIRKHYSFDLNFGVID